MLDLRFIRENPDAVKRAVQVKGVDLNIDELLQLDRDLVALKQRVESLLTERNANAKLVPKASADERPALIQKGKDLAEDIRALEPQQRAHEEQLKQLLLRVPNTAGRRARRQGRLRERGVAPRGQVARV